MRVIVVCETSGKTREAFRKRGHEAWSCDLLPPDDGSPYHFQTDMFWLLFHAFPPYYWDLMIAHPDCTYLTSAGLHWNKRVPGRAEKTEKAIADVRRLMSAPVAKWAIENPSGCISTRIRKPDQSIQPWMFGHDASKKTCLWLHNLPPLVIDPARAYPPRMVKQPNGKVLPRWGNQTDSGQNKLPPSKDRWKIRSETYQGIADAFAENWG